MDDFFFIFRAGLGGSTVRRKYLDSERLVGSRFVRTFVSCGFGYTSVFCFLGFLVSKWDYNSYMFRCERVRYNV